MRFFAALSGLLLLGWFATPSQATIPEDAELLEVQISGPTPARLNLVLLSDGYQSNEREKFITDAGIVADGILSAEPLATYKAFFNVYGIFVSSVDSGSDHPGQGVFKDTYFNSTYDSYGIQRLVTIPPNDRNSRFADGQGKVTELLRALIPDYDISAVVVNDGEYGGSGGSTLVVSTHRLSAEVATHELGHTFAHLGDEYGDAYPGFPDTEEPNTTRETVREKIKWASWIDAATPIPTPVNSGFGGSVGLFQGAHYHVTGWYRPKENCRMRTLGVPFCEVCSQELVRSIYHLISPVTSVSPSVGSPVALTATTPFQLELLHPKSDTLSVSWTMNGVALTPVVANPLELSPSMCTAATNELVALVEDQTPLIRAGASGTPRWSYTWKVVVEPRPLVRASLLGDSIELSWPGDFIGYEVETTSGVTPGLWEKLASTPVLRDGEWHVLVSLQAVQGFYRVRRP